MYKLKDYPGRIEAAELELLELKNTLRLAKAESERRRFHRH